MDLAPVLARLERSLDDHLAELVEFVSIPSVSAQPEHKADVDASRDWLVARLRRAGFDDVRIVPTSGNDSVLAVYDGAGHDAPTLLAYGHYDVQPASKEDGWIHEPFTPVIDGDRIWGRGTTDDKGQLLCHVLAAEAWLQEHGALPVNLRLIFEGEEEIGSVHFDEVIDVEADAMQADLLVVSDSPMYDETTPGVTVRLRGMAIIQVDVQGPEVDLHSGTWGGVVRNPVEALTQMLAGLKDPDTGRILVPGFYDGVAAPPQGLVPPISDEKVTSGTGSPQVFGEAGFSNEERVGFRPTLDINGIWGGYQGEGMKTIIPASAHAKISCRTVPDQDSAGIRDLLRAHLEAAAPAGVTVTVTDLGDGDWVSADPQGPMVEAVRAALRDTWHTEPVVLAEGGSIPAVADMQQRLGVVPILAGFGHRDENMHAPDESFRVSSFAKGRAACARLLANLATAKQA